jgi:quercetin dioxygenase-like cupin family protein
MQWTGAMASAIMSPGCIGIGWEARPMRTISLGGLELRFVQDRHETGGSLTAFEMTVQPNARMPIAHYHDTWDETVYGLTGGTTWRVGGKDVGVAPGESLFIPRRTVHGFRNDGNGPATCLCILTPGVLGSEYFAEMATLLSGSAPDPAQLKTVMLKYGLVPAPND